MINWLVANWETALMLVMTCLGALVMVLKVVAPMTPTSVDNRVLGVLVKVIAFLSGLVTPKLKEPATDDPQ